jgi:hypothetical protein
MPDHEHERPDPDQPGVVHVGIAGPVAGSGSEAPPPPPEDEQPTDDEKG